MKQVVIEVRSAEDLERGQDNVISYVQEKGEPVCCLQHLKLPANAPCLCGSGRKWKKCCMWESRTQVTFYPKGWEFRRKRSKLAGILAAAALAGLAGGLEEIAGS